MNTILPYYLFTGFFLITALQQTLIGIYSKRKMINITFGGFALVWAIYEINMIGMLKAGRPDEYVFYLNTSRLILIFSAIVQLFFISLYSRIYLKKLLIFIFGLSLLTLFLTLINPLHATDINFSQIHHGLSNAYGVDINLIHTDIFVLILNYALLVLVFLYTMLVLMRFYKITRKIIALLLIISFTAKFILDLALNFHSIFHSIVFNNEYSNLMVIVILSLFIAIDMRNGGSLKQKIEYEAEMKEFKNQAVRYIVHDFKAPLSVLSSVTVNDSKEKILDMTNAYSTNMLNLVGNMLEVYKFSEGALKINKAKLNMSSIIEESLRSVAPIANKKNIEFVLNIDDDSVVEADGDLLKRVFVNLFYDIIKCLAENGKIIINSSYSLSSGFYFNLTAPGLDTSNLNVNSLFEGNELSQNDIKTLSFSTGLSLMFCKIVVTGHLGNIGIENSDGKTMIWLTLPNALESEVINESKAVVYNRNLKYKLDEALNKQRARNNAKQPVYAMGLRNLQLSLIKH